MQHKKKKHYFGRKPHYHKKPDENGNENPESASAPEGEGERRPETAAAEANADSNANVSQEQKPAERREGENPNRQSSRRRRNPNRFNRSSGGDGSRQENAGGEQREQRERPDHRERFTPNQRQEEEDTGPIDPNAPVCPICEAPIRNVLTAIRHKESGNLAHFDCIIKVIRTENTEKLGKHRRIYYIGAGNFAIVRERYDKRGRLRNYHIIERISYESKGD